jgi:hypothetical protein
MFSYRSPPSIATLHYDLMSIVWFLFWGCFLLFRPPGLYYCTIRCRDGNHGIMGAWGGGREELLALPLYPIAYTDRHCT